MKGNKTKFSIIIPTRERCDTLVWALKSCTEQNYEDLEIIVSDNFSRDGTRDVVESNRDKRIKYFNTGKRISMAHNYEFALSNSTGDFVTIIGDDDAMITNIFDEIDELIQELLPEILTWDKATYVWPNFIDESSRNILNLPYKRKTVIRKVDSDDFLTRLLRFEGDYAKTIFSKEFPSIYHGFVSRKVIQSATVGERRYFNSRIPDIYSGVAMASVVPQFWHTSKALSVRGASSHSIGAAQFNGDETAGNPATQFLQEDNIPFHPDVLFCYSLPIMVLEGLFQVYENLPNARRTNFEIKCIIRTALTEGMSKSIDVYEEIIAAVIAIGKKHDLDAFTFEQIRNHPHQLPSTMAVNIKGYHPIAASFYFDGCQIGVQNVFEAAQFCERVLRDDSVTFLMREYGKFAINAVRKWGVIKSVRKVIGLDI